MWLLGIVIGSSRCLPLLWLVGVIALVLVFRQSLENRSNRKWLNLTQSSIFIWRFRCSCCRSFLNSLSFYQRRGREFANVRPKNEIRFFFTTQQESLKTKNVRKKFESSSESIIWHIVKLKFRALVISPSRTEESSLVHSANEVKRSFAIAGYAAFPNRAVINQDYIAFAFVERNYLRSAVQLPIWALATSEQNPQKLAHQ